LPPYISTFLDIGCGAGRNLLPFNGKLKLWGTDIVDATEIHWITEFKNFTYEKVSVEALTRRFEKEDIDLSTTCIHTAGVLMYVSKEYQERFFSICRRRGCINFIFYEPPPDSTRHPKQNFKLSPELFQQIRPSTDKEGKTNSSVIYLYLK
jgi:hypothetical protein